MQEIIVSFSKSFPREVHMPAAQMDCNLKSKSDGCQKATDCSSNGMNLGASDLG